MSSSPPSARPPAAVQPPVALLALAYLAFVSLGLPDTVLGIAWPSLRSSFDLPQAAMGAALASAAVAYFISGLLAGRLIRVLGIGALLALSTALVAVGVFGYALAPGFPHFLAAAAVVGFGSGAVDAALNTYAATGFGPRHMAWLHAAYSLGAALGPALMTVLVASRAAGWRMGYGLLATVLSALTVCFFAARKRWDAPTGATLVDAPGIASEASVEVVASPVSAWQVLKRRPVLVQVALFFLYAGVEVTAGQWSFTVLSEGRGLSAAHAGTLASLYWASILGGRIASGFVVERIGQARLLRGCMFVAVLGAAVFALPGMPGAVSGLGLVILGLALAPIYPGLMSETPGRVGNGAAAHAVGFQVSAATAGIAAVPSLAGGLAGGLGLATVPVLIVAVSLALVAVHELGWHRWAGSRPAGC